MFKKKETLTGLALPVVIACAMLTGCATKPVSLYQWDGYQPQVYEYLKGQKSVPEQIDALEKARDTVSTKDQALPPGFRAHLGMLYATVGKSAEARQQLTEEKERFPESSAYMDFLLSKLQ
ncbi:DUF4810 domain-containing protein [Caballeronia insecticola]|uniref:Putative lipoprotein n=1 Tax=Caballeronia insecticola TaxID=758793 RepID=R4WKZ5_9BURK|nr:DUF4810 domain-containing protein [Caballeronia insecticola]BAN25129.1 putative lipoprotein [Caballeronia insecticola]